MVKKNKAIFLDRDGVLSRSKLLNKKAYAPRKFKDFKLFPYVKFYLKKLKKKNFKLIVITNQPDINNKLVKIEEVNKMNHKLKSITAVDEVYMCPHSQKEKCSCRKPNPGMIIKASKKYSIDIKKSYLIGDRNSDIEAGIKVKCKNIFIDRGYVERKPKKDVIFVKSFRQAAEYILKNN